MTFLDPNKKLLQDETINGDINYGNKLDYSYDPGSMAVAAIPPSPQALQAPQGFGDRFAAANSEGKILGMDPHRYAMLAGALAHALAPTTPIGRMGKAVADYGQGQYNQAMKEKEPVYRAGTQQQNALERTAANLTLQGNDQAVPAQVDPTAQTTPTQGFGAKLSLMQPGASLQNTAVAPTAIQQEVNPQQQVVDPYTLAQGVTEGARVHAANMQNPYYVPTQESELGLRKAQAEHAQAGTRLQNEEAKYIGPKAEAEMSTQRAHAGMLDVERALAIPKFEVDKAFKAAEIKNQQAHVAIAGANTRIAAGHLQLAAAGMQQKEREMQESRAQRLLIDKSTHLQQYGEGTKGLAEKYAKDLENPMLPQSKTRFSYGLQFINRGLMGKGYSEAWKDNMFANQGKDLVYQGVNDVIAAINGIGAGKDEGISSQFVSQKQSMYDSFMTQIQPLKKRDPDLYRAMTNQLNSALVPYRMGYGLLGISKPLWSRQEFNPSEAAKRYPR